MASLLLRKLLSRNISPFQLAGFVLANLFGMTIVLTSVQFYTDVLPLFTGNDSFLKPGQVIIAKQVSALRTISGAPPVFKSDEIDALRRQPFIQSVGTFTPSLYHVMATIGGDALGMQMTTEMFFESVPDDYLDIDLTKWHRNHPDGDTIPIVLPRTYLNLYNFGFAGNRGLPTISEGLVGIINIHLLLTGTHGKCRLIGKVVDFSRRLNTILIPQSFMESLNARLCPGIPAPPSRLILQVNNPADERIADYLQANGYDTESNDADASRTAGFLKLVILLVMGVGVLITALSFYVLLLSIFLLLQKHTEKIDSLMLIGYAPHTIARFYDALSLVANIVILALSLALTLLLRNYYLPHFGELYPSYTPSALFLTLLTGIVLFVVTSVFNYLSIRRKVIAVWKMHTQ